MRDLRLPVAVSESLEALSKKAHTHNNILRENFQLKRTVVQTDLQEAPADGAELQ